jgi:hypothetical protein
MNKTVKSDETVTAEHGWRFRRTISSLPEAHRSVTVAQWAESAWIFRKLLTFRSGQSVAVGYMDRENRATELAGVRIEPHTR